MAKVTLNDDLTFQSPPALVAEEPIDAHAHASDYVIMHSLVNAHSFLDIVPAATLGDRVAIERLLSLGAIAPKEHAITRLELLGYSAAAAELASKLTS
jgi:hypothetical protein